MKEKLIELVIQAIITLITQLLKKAEENEKEVAFLKKEYEKDALLAKEVRKAYPTSSDESIIKDLC